MITLKTLAKATKQEVFDQVARHLLTQGEKAEKGNRCRYRLGKLKCAAGCLISDKEYMEKFDEDIGAWDDMHLEGYVPKKHYQMICRLQDIHDYNNPIKWFQNLEQEAKKSRVNQKVLREFG